MISTEYAVSMIPVAMYGVTWAKPLEKLNLENIKWISIHHSGLGPSTIKAMHNDHLEKWPNLAGLGYNYVILPNGDIVQARGLYLGNQTCDINREAISVCLAGNFDVSEPTGAQISSVERLCAFLLTKVPGLKLNPSTILPHSAFSQTSCPGKNVISKITDIRKGASLKVGGGAVVQAYMQSNSSYIANSPPRVFNNSPYQIYYIRKTDNSWDSIAKYLGIAKSSLFAINEINDSTQIKAGRIIYAPVVPKSAYAEYVKSMKSAQNNTSKNVSTAKQATINKAIFDQEKIIDKPIADSGNKKTIMGINVRNFIPDKLVAYEYEKFRLVIMKDGKEEIIQFRIDPLSRGESFNQNVSETKTKGGFIISRQPTLGRGSISGYFIDTENSSESDDFIRAYKSKIENDEKVITKMYIGGTWLLVELLSVNINASSTQGDILKSYSFSYIILKDTRVGNLSKNAVPKITGSAIKTPIAQAAIKENDAAINSGIRVAATSVSENNAFISTGVGEIKTVISKTIYDMLQA